MLVLLDLAGIAFLLALVASPIVRDASHRLGFVDKPDEVRKADTRPIPRVGGVAIAFAYATTLGIVFILPYDYLPFDAPSAWGSAWPLLPAAGVVFLTGLLDDLVRLKPLQKLAGQLAGAGLAYWAGFGVDTLAGQPLDAWIAFPVTLLWLVACSNALNLIDGMDGLAAGVGFFATATMLIAALIHDQVSMAIVTAPLLGALLGFLRYNFNPASMFLGDSGSLLVGFLLGCYGAQWAQKSATILSMTAPLIALSLPLLDTTLAVARRFLRNRSIFAADRGHIHHKLLEMGWTPRRVALVLYALCGLAAALSLLSDTIDNRFSGLIIVVFCGAAWLGVQHLGYAEFGVASRLLVRGQLRGMIDAQLRLQAFEREVRSSKDRGGFWNALARGCQEFEFRGVRFCVAGFERATPLVEGETSQLRQLRIPFGSGQYVNLYRDPHRRMHPIVLDQFSDIVEGAVRDAIARGLFRPPSLSCVNPDREAVIEVASSR